MSSSSEYYDYEEGKRRITQLLKNIRSHGWSPTPEVRRLRSLIEDLESMANRLGGHEWFYLEAAHDADSPKEIDVTGYPVSADVSNQGRYASLRYRLTELAETARQQIEELPNPRQRPEVPRAAELLMHLRYHCGFPPPTIYESSDFVIDFDEVCKAAGVHLSLQRLINIVSEVLQNFDSSAPPLDLTGFLIVKPPPSDESVG